MLSNCGTAEDSWESPGFKIKLVNSKGNQSWIFFERTDAEAETPILWPPDAKNWLIGKDLEAGKDWRQEEKGMTENEMVGWNHQLNGHEFEQAPGDGEGQGSLGCCSPWGAKESDMTEWLNNKKNQGATYKGKLTKYPSFAKIHIVVVVQLLSHVRLFATPWTAAPQASLSFTISWSLLKFISIDLVMPSNYLILCCPLLLLPSIFPGVMVFSKESVLYIRWLKYWNFSISPSNKYSGLISFRMDWLDLLAVQGTLKSSPTPQFKSISS